MSAVRCHARFAKAPVALAGALFVAACGLVTPNPTPTASPSAPATPEATPAATATATATVEPTPTIVPVPTPRFDLAGSARVAQLGATTETALASALDSIRAGAALPGIQAAIVFPDGSTWTGQSGVGVITTAAPVTADTLFSVASITKTFVATLAIRLAGRGTIGLDDPLSRYVPSYPNAAAITLRELLSHTSGIHDLFTSPGMSDDILANPSRIWTPQEVLARIGKPYFAPGKGYYYSNTNYVLLGLVVEKATHRNLAALVREEFLTPLGLSHTFLQTEERTVGVVAHGYNGSAAKPVDLSIGQTMVPFTSEVTACSSACAIVSSAQDLARWGSALYGGGVLDAAEMASMLDTTAALPYPSFIPRGLGAEVINLGGRIAWGHRGHLDGFDGSMMYMPESGLTIVVQANAEWANALAASATLANVVLGVPPSASPSPPGASPTPSVSPS